MAYGRQMVLTAACAAALTGSAVAQTSGQDILVPPSGPQPYASTSSSIFNPQPAASDAEWLRSGLSAARSGNVEQLRLAESAMVGATARKVLEWAAADIMPAGLSFAELDRARADLQAWPRKANRQAAAERALETSGLSPQEIVNWFRRQDPATPEGAMALGGALEQLGRPGDAQALIRRVWRDKAFDLDKQRLMLTRFGALLTPQDHIRRADTLLYADVGPALRDLLPLLPPEEQQTAEARIALRTGSASGEALYDALPPARQHDPGVAVERARWLYDRGRGEEALPLIADFPRNPPPDASSRFWALRRALVNVAVKVGDYADAHRAVDDHGLPPGADAADAEFLGGWLALTKLHDPADAEQHFGRLEYMGASPITISRALYWRGRAEEALGDPIAAQASYGRGARYYTAFYGQMAAAKAGLTEIVLDKDPAPTAQDRAAFESRELVQAARLLARAGANDLYRVLMIASAESLPTTADMAMLVDMADAEADPELSMRIVRLAAQRGLVLPERGYPLRRPPQTSPVEAPFVLGIIRQESGFDPSIRSGAGARGMMQLMPATARHLARRSGMRYRDSMLDDPEYNMRLGSNFLGDLVNQFDGSYVLATAAYNAGPGRPTQWTATCGDPRAAAIDPVDYIECIPISETRNYVMRVLENIQVYRARLNGGRAPLTLPADLKRGGYGQPRPYAEIAQNASAQNELAQNTLSPGASSASDRVPAWSAAIADAVASTQIPDPSESPRLIKAVHDNRADGHARLRKVALKAHHAAAHGGHHGKSRRRRS